jgi:hypothetical protein
LLSEEGKTAVDTAVEALISGDVDIKP